MTTAHEFAPPSIDEVAAFVRRFAGLRDDASVTATTLLQADLGVTGDDGCDLLKDVASEFGIVLATPADGYHASFELAPDQQLFDDEGWGLPGLRTLARLLGAPLRAPARDLSVGELHEALCRATARNA